MCKGEDAFVDPTSAFIIQWFVGTELYYTYRNEIYTVTHDMHKEVSRAAVRQDRLIMNSLLTRIRNIHHEELHIAMRK